MLDSTTIAASHFFTSTWIIISLRIPPKNGSDNKGEGGGNEGDDDPTHSAFSQYPTHSAGNSAHNKVLR